MKNKDEVITYCKTFKDVYEDYPFDDGKWALMRQVSNRKSFAMVYQKDGLTWINVKCDPEWISFWRAAYSAVVPAYHMNKKHWNSIILDGTIPETDVKRMIAESYDLVYGKKVTKGSKDTNNWK